MNSQGLRVGTIGNENLHRREDPGREPIALKDLPVLVQRHRREQEKWAELRLLEDPTPPRVGQRELSVRRESRRLGGG